MWKKIAINLLRYRRVYLFFILLFTFILGFLLFQNGIKFSKSNAQLLPSSDSAMIQFEEFKKTFGRDENLIVIGIKSKNFFENKNFNHWLKLTQDIEKINGVKNIISLGKAIYLVKDTVHQKFIIEKVLNEVKNLDDFNKAYTKIQQLPFYNNILYNKKTGAIQTGIYLESSLIDSHKRELIVLKIKEKVDNFEKETKITTYLSGMPVIRTLNGLEIKSESSKFILLSLLVTCFIFFLLFRSIKATLLTSVIMILSVLVSFSILSILGYEVTVLTALVPPILIILSVQNTIYILNEYLYEYEIYKNKAKALILMISKIGNALLMINLTTAFGFFTFIFTGSKTLREFGWITSINIIVVSILVLLLNTIFLSYFKPIKITRIDKRIEEFFSKYFINKIIYIVEYQRKWVYIICVVVFLLSLFGMSLIKSMGNMLDEMSKKADFYKDISFFDENFNGVLPLEIIIKGEPNTAVSLSTLTRVNQLQQYIESLHQSSAPISIVNLAKFTRQAYYNGDPTFYALPTKNENPFISTYIKNTKGEGKLLKNYVNTDRSQIRVTTLLKNSDSKSLESTMDSIKSKLRNLFPKEKYKFYFTGIAYIFMKGTDYLTKYLLVSILSAIVLIILFMVFMFRSKRMIFIALLPNILPLIFTAGFMGYMGIPFKPSTILVFSIAFGIVVDNSIHFLSKYRHELQKNNAKISQSVIIALQETGRSIFFTSLVLFLGFLVFVFSSFEGIVALGGLIAIALFISMLTNIILLPSLIMSQIVPTDKDFVHPDIDVFEEEKLEETEIKGIQLKDEM